MILKREEALARLDAEPWDVVVIGGGASGLGTAVDSASRGYRTLLLEQHDFAKGTSSRSTKLIHGGVRYLRQGNVGLVRESLRERGRLLRNAPELVFPLQFLIPTSSPWETAFYWAGMKAYDLLAGRLGIGRSGRLSRGEVLQQLPTLSPSGLSGGVCYFDARFDDARLAVALAKTLHRLGGTAVNYMPVRDLLKQEGRVSGVVARDAESDREYRVRARVVVNATGAFGDAIRKIDDANARETLSLSQGIHLVLDQSYFPGDTALIVPKTEDGRVLFFIPWQGFVLVGTTDTPVGEATLEPRPREEEIDYLLDYTARYLVRAPQRSDVLSTFAGLRPLVRRTAGRPTSQLARDHVVDVSTSGLVNVSGGKWTTYRLMGEDAIDAARGVGGLKRSRSQTASLRLSTPGQAIPPAERSAVVTEEVILRAVREEMARTVEDVLSRRTRLLVCDVRSALEAAPFVATVMAREFNRSQEWQAEQMEQFQQLAAGYMI